MPRLRVFVSGKVQGVFYRDSTRQRALELGCAGWVRNLPDGRVEVVLEGEREPLDAMVQWLARGPPDARVDDVEARAEEPEGLVGFEIQRTPR